MNYTSTNLPPTIRERKVLLYETKKVSPHQRRFLDYLEHNPNAITHDIANNAQISYPPSVIRKLNTGLLPGVGLAIQRIKQGKSLTAESRWRLTKFGE